MRRFFMKYKRTFGVIVIATIMVNLHAQVQVAMQNRPAQGYFAQSGRIEYIPTVAQRGADCGYHAIYNGLAYFFKLQSLEQPPFSLEQWRDYIIRLRTKRCEENMPKYDEACKSLARWHELEKCCQQGLVVEPHERIFWEQQLQALKSIKPTPIKPRAAGRGQWLDDGEIEVLIRDVVYKDLVARSDYTIIPNITALTDLPQEVWGIDMTAWQKLKTTPGTLHIFILGNMAQQGAQCIDGHWIAVVAQNRGGELVYSVLDSLNSKRSEMVDALVHLVMTR
jgi:hypothetical protein